MSLTRDLVRFSGCSAAEKLLCIEAFIILGVCRLMILLLPFGWIVRILKLKEGGPSTGTGAPPLFLSRAGWAIAAAASRTPWQSVCLGQGLTGMIMFRLRSLPATLYLGVARDGGEMAAHAWLCCGDQIITGATGHERYAVISTYSSGGKRQS